MGELVVVKAVATSIRHPGDQALSDLVKPRPIIGHHSSRNRWDSSESRQSSGTSQ